MVHCRNLVNGECSFTGGRCILKNPTTIEQYKLCNGRQLVKDWSEMSRIEKAYITAIENKKKIIELEKRLLKLEGKQVVAHVVRSVERRVPVEKKKKGGLLEWVRCLGK